MIAPQERVCVIDGVIVPFSPSWETYCLLKQLQVDMVQMRDILDRADQYDPEYITRVIYCLSQAQEKIDRYQSPTFGPD